MREILTTTPDEAARAPKFVQRSSPLRSATFTQMLVFGFLANPQATLEQLTQTAANLAMTISPQGLQQRFTEAAETLPDTLASVWRGCGASTACTSS